VNDSDIIRTCVDAFDVGAVVTWRSHGGTAGKTWRLTTDRGEWFVRLRGVRTSDPALVAWDHALRRHLVERGIPTAVPLQSRVGRTFVQVGDRACEMYPFVDGVTLQHADLPAVESAAKALAHFHEAARDFTPACKLPPVSQYATVGVPDRSDRLEDPRLLTKVYETLAAEPEAKRFQKAIDVARRWLDRLLHHFSDAVYNALPHTVVHGDYTLANLLFDPHRRRVCGIFDLDWARPGPRVRDVADGLFFIAGRRRSPLQAGDIRSLTEPVDLLPDRCTLWLRTYMQAARLTLLELQCVPLALAGRWLSVRVEGMAKTPPEERFEFCFGPLPDPLEQLDARWPEILRAAEADDPNPHVHRWTP